jgi:hypothetical protein
LGLTSVRIAKKLNFAELDMEKMGKNEGIRINYIYTLYVLSAVNPW